MRNALILIGLLAATPLAGAEIYKWVDSQGRVQYSDQPPTSGSATKLTPSGAPSAGKSAPSYTDQERDFRKRQIETAEKEKKQQQAEAHSARKQQNCEQARARLRSLEAGGRQYTVNEKGERQYLDDLARESAMAEARKAIDEWCS